MQEREEKLLRLYESQQQRAFDRVNRGSASSNSSITSTSTANSTTGGKVRQMFDERRQKAGIDRSYPLEPINKTNKTNNGFIRLNGVKSTPSTIATTRTLVKSSIEKSTNQIKNGAMVANKSSLKETLYNNNSEEESYLQRVFEKDNLDNGFMKTSSSELVALMNNHNLNDSLDNEMPPHFEEQNQPIFCGKLANLGGKLPSENGITKRSVPYTAAKAPVVKKEAKVSNTLAKVNIAQMNIVFVVV